MSIDLHDDDLIDLLNDLETNSPVEYELLMKNEPEIFKNQYNKNQTFVNANTAATNENNNTNGMPEEFYSNSNGYTYNNNTNDSHLNGNRPNNNNPKSINLRNINSSTFPLANGDNGRNNAISMRPATKPFYSSTTGTNGVTTTGPHLKTSSTPSSSSSSSSSNYMPTAHNISSQSIVFEDYSPQDIAVENRIKSYELRLKGQIRTIRSLESQLTQSHQNNQEQQKYLLLSQNRIKLLESKERSLLNKQNQYNNNNSNNSSNSSNNDSPRTPIQKFDEQLITKYEEALQVLETRCSEEISKRLKSEERSRSFKEHYDKLKQENSNLENQLKGLFRTNHDVTNKLNKYKKECKELVVEVSVQREDIHNKGILIDQQRDRIKRAETAMRTTLNEMSKLREEAQFQHKECMNAHSMYKLAQIEIIALKEREVRRRAELKLQQVSTTAATGGSANRVGSSVDGIGRSSIDVNNNNNNNTIYGDDGNEEKVILSARSQAQSRSLLRSGNVQSQRYHQYSSSASDPGINHNDDDDDDMYESRDNKKSIARQYGSFTNESAAATAAGVYTRPPRHPRSSSACNRQPSTAVRRGGGGGTASDSEALHSPYRLKQQQQQQQQTPTQQHFVPLKVFRQTSDSSNNNSNNNGNSSNSSNRHQSRERRSRDDGSKEIIPQYQKPTSSSTASLQAHRHMGEEENDNDGNSSVYSMHSLLGKLHSQGRLSENSSPTHSPSRVSTARGAHRDTRMSGSNSSPLRRSSKAPVTTTTGAGGRVGGRTQRIVRDDDDDDDDDDGRAMDSSNTSSSSIHAEELKWEAIKQKAAIDARREFLIEQQQLQQQQRDVRNTGIHTSTTYHKEQEQDQGSADGGHREMNNNDEGEEEEEEDKYRKLKRMYKRVTGHNINKLDHHSSNNKHHHNDDEEEEEDSY